VADRGMISRETVRELESTPSVDYILGVRIRNQKEIGVEVLSRAGRYEEVTRRQRQQEPLTVEGKGSVA